jgi:hypothetical protein
MKIVPPHFYKVNQEVVKSFEVCFYNTPEKCRENVTLRLESSTCLYLNIDVPALLKEDEGTKPNMLNVVNVGLKASPLELFMDDEAASMELLVKVESQWSEEAHGPDFGNLLPSLDYGLESTLGVEDYLFKTHTTHLC